MAMALTSWSASASDGIRTAAGGTAISIGGALICLLGWAVAGMVASSISVASDVEGAVVGARDPQVSAGVEAAAGSLDALR